MRAALVMLMLALVAVTASGESRAWTHTRATSPAAKTLLRLATERSPLTRALVEDLERTDVVVYLIFSIEPVAQSTPAFMTFLTEAAGTRYVAIHLWWKSAPQLEYVPLLAHELQHALELAAAADVHDQEGYLRLFREIGWSSGTQRFETQGARAMEQRVRDELAGQPT